MNSNFLRRKLDKKPKMCYNKGRKEKETKA